MKKILICTGGTGGHIFPVIALTEYLKKKNFDIEVVTDWGAVEFVNDTRLFILHVLMLNQ